MPGLRLHAVAFLILMMSFAHMAQTPFDYHMEMKKDFLSWAWIAGVQSQFPLGNAAQLTINDQFSSNLYRQSSKADKWRDENSLEIGWQVPLSEKLSTRTLIQSRIFADQNTVIEFSKHLAAQELLIKPFKKIEISPAVGGAFEEAFGENDAGWYGHMGVKINRLDMGGYINDTAAKSTYRGFPGRQNEAHTFFTGWRKQFSPYASDSVRIGYQFSESRYYLRPSNDNESSNLEAVTAISRFLYNQLQYRFSRRSQLVMATTFRNQSVNQINPNLNSLRREIALENQLDYLIGIGPLRSQSGLVFSQSNNNNPGLRTDVNTLQTAMNQRIDLAIGQQNSMWSKLSFTKFEYNTPEATSEDERRLRDDRDELRYLFDLGVKRIFSPYFSATLRGSAFLYHQIYIRSGRSSKNNWNRVYQLATNLDHRLSGRVHHSNQVKILANYTVFDFDDILPGVNSYVFRKLVFSDSTVVKLTGNLSVNTYYQLELEDNGRFFEEDFSQQVTREQAAHFFSVSLLRQNFYGLDFTTGFTFFQRNEWAFRPLREKSREFRSITPRMTIAFRRSQRFMVYASYAPTRTSNFGHDRRYFTTGALTVKYRL